MARLGQLRYYLQGVPQPERQYACDYNPQQQQQEDPTRGITCPSETVNVGATVMLTFNPGTADDANFQYDWFISQGEGVIDGSASEPEVAILATTEGVVEVTLLLHDMSTSDPQVVDVYTCTFVVGVVAGSDTPSADELQGFCPTQFVLDQPADAWVEGPLLSSLAYKEWYVLGTWFYDVAQPNAAKTQITFYETGSFQVVFEAYTDDGMPVYLWQNVEVVATGSGSGPEPQPSVWVGEYQGDLTDPPAWAQEIYLTVDGDGTVTGLVVYDGGAEYNLYGFVLDDGYIYFEDDAELAGYALGIYEGEWGTAPIGVDGFVGTYYETDFSNPIGEWAVIPVTGG